MELEGLSRDAKASSSLPEFSSSDTRKRSCSKASGGASYFGREIGGDERALLGLGCSIAQKRSYGSKLSGDDRSLPTLDDSGARVGSFGPRTSGDDRCGDSPLSSSSGWGV